MSGPENFVNLRQSLKDWDKQRPCKAESVVEHFPGLIRLRKNLSCRDICVSVTLPEGTGDIFPVLSHNGSTKITGGIKSVHIEILSMSDYIKIDHLFTIVEKGRADVVKCFASMIIPVETVDFSYIEEIAKKFLTEPYKEPN